MPRVRRSVAVAVSEKILVFGASSYVGKHLIRKLGQDRAIGTYNRTPIDNGRHFDSLHMRVGDIFDGREQVSHAVILIGDTDPDSCVADPALSRAINVESTKTMIDDLLALGVKIIFTSTEFVFDGNRGMYNEKDKINPILLYGEQKAEIEIYLQTVAPDACILRLAKVYGLTPSDGTLFTGMFDLIRSTTTIRCAGDQIFSPVYVGDVVNAILAGIETPLSGLFHIAGPDTNSRLGFLHQVIEEEGPEGVMNLEVAECSIHDFDLPEPRPLNVSMNSDKLFSATGLNFLRSADACKRICEATSKTA